MLTAYQTIKHPWFFLLLLLPSFCCGMDFPYSFVHPPYVSPYLIVQLTDPIAGKTNDVMAVQVWSTNSGVERSESLSFDADERFSYEYKGTTDSRVHVLLISKQTDQPGSLLFIAFDVVSDLFDPDQQKVWMRRVGEHHLGDQWDGSVEVKGNRVLINVGSMLHEDDSLETTLELSPPAVLSFDHPPLYQQEEKREDPLVRAICYDHPEEAKKLLEAGATVDRDLMLLACGRSVDCTTLLLDAGAPIDGRDAKGDTPLHLIQRSPAIVQRLIDLQADLNAQNNEGQTPLHLAIRYNYPKIVFLLLENGARVDILDAEGNSPLDVALQECVWSVDKEVVEALYSRKSPVNSDGPSILGAASYGLLSLVQQLLARGAPINGKPDWGSTPLMTALQAEQYEMATLLIEQDADCSLADRYDATPLTVTASLKKKEILVSLLKHGAKITPDALEWAIRSDWVEGARILLDAGADLQAVRGPLSIAAGSASLEMVDFLLPRGADLHQSTEYGDTPFLAAVERGDVAMIKALIAHGALEAKKE